MAAQRASSVVQLPVPIRKGIIDLLPVPALPFVLPEGGYSIERFLAKPHLGSSYRVFR